MLHSKIKPDPPSDLTAVTSSTENVQETGVQTRLAESLLELLESVISERKEYYEQHPDEIPDRQSLSSIIKAYSMKNAAISGGASLVPGPWGMLVAIPEIAAVFRYQIMMIDEIGRAYGKERVITKELVAGILLTALGSSGAALLTIHGERVLVRRVALRVLQKMARLIAAKTTQQLLKSMISKWLPVIGAAAMAVWSSHMTHKVGQRAIEIFEKNIELSDEVGGELFAAEELHEDSSSKNFQNVPPSSMERMRVQALINLMKVDGAVASEERYYLQTLIEQVSLSDEENLKLSHWVESDEKLDVHFEYFSSKPDEAVALMMDLIALAQRDGVFHITEKMYIKQAGKLMGFSSDDIEAMMLTSA